MAGEGASAQSGTAGHGAGADDPRVELPLWLVIALLRARRAGTSLSRMELPVRGPFHLEATVRLLQRRPSNIVDVWTGDRYTRVLPAGRGYVVCTVRNLGSIEHPSLELSLEPRPGSRPGAVAIAHTVTRILGLEEDPGFAVPGLDDPRLRALERALRGARPPRFPSLFESLCRVVPYQQLSLEAGGVIVSRFVQRFGRRADTASGSAWAFPDAAIVAAATPERFAGIGFSTTKIACLRNVAALVSTGQLKDEDIERLPTEAALDRLDALPGIGPWSAALVLLRGFRRMDVFPEGDVGAQRGLARIVGSKRSIARALARAGDRRGYLYFYALGAQLLERGLIHPANGGTEFLGVPAAP